MASDGKGRLSKQARIAAIDTKTLDGNQISCNFRNDGIFGYSDAQWGMFWPKGNDVGAMYASCLWMAGLEHTSGTIRASAGYSETDFRPGTINGVYDATAAVAANKNDPRFHIYKISKSDVVGGVNADYDQWPVDQGAPVDGNGKPRFFGDQQLFFVFNDLDPAARSNMSACPPFGIEVRVLAWCFNNNSFLQDVIFVRWEIVNKSIFTYDSTYVGLFEDVDLGDAEDDQTGCDTTRSLCFFYNSNEADYYDSRGATRWPAEGTIFLQAPSQTSSRNPMTHFLPGMKNGIHFADIPHGLSKTAGMAYNYLRALDENGNSIVDPISNKMASYIFSGDPVTNTGWVPEIGWPPYATKVYPGDRRMIPSSGPFVFAPGDTQEFVVAIVMAQGQDRLSSLSKVRLLTDNVRSFYQNPQGAYPEVDVSSNVLYTSPTQTSVELRAVTKNVTQISTSLMQQDGSVVATMQLYDDGQHGDGLVSDGTFANSVFVAPARSSLRADLKMKTSTNDNIPYSAAISRITVVPPPTIERLSVLSDSRNGDGHVNPGEYISANLVVSNQSSFDYDSLFFWASELLENWASVRLLPVGSEMISDGTLYMSIPNNAPAGPLLGAHFYVTEPTRRNLWFDSVLVSIEPFNFLPIDVPAQHVQGNATGTFKIHLTAPSLWRNKEYKIVIPQASRYSLIDNASGDTLISKNEIWNWPYAQYIDGFDISGGTLVGYDGSTVNAFETAGPAGSAVAPGGGQARNDPGLDVFLKPNSTGEWSVSAWVPGNTPSVSSIGRYYGGRHDFEFRFTSSGSEYYIGHSTPDSISRKASNRVPFEIWDIGETPDDPKDDVRLIVGVVDKNSNNAWDALSDSSLSEPIYAAGYLPYKEPLPSTSLNYSWAYSQISSVIFIQSSSQHFSIPKTGTVIRLVSGKAPSVNDVYLFNPVQLKQSVLPVDYVLRQNFPNPFNPSTTISFKVYQRGEVSLKIYNILGQEIATLINDVEEVGDHNVQWTGTTSAGRQAASGIYFCYLKAGSQSQVKKMLLIR